MRGGSAIEIGIKIDPRSKKGRLARNGFLFNLPYLRHLVSERHIISIHKIKV
jgi:hypothetical protein